MADPDLNEMRNAMLGIAEAMEPMREFGKGYRMKLLEDGWSTESADRIAAEAMIELLRKAMRP